MTPTVSIIIPCFNAQAFIAEAIESALDQAYSPTDVVVVDDGSTDGTMDVVRRFARHIRYETGPNRGACSARNQGLRLARGQFIQFLDADDLLHPDKIARQLPYVISHPGALVFCDGEERDAATGHLTARYHRPLPAGLDPVVYMCRGTLLTPAPLHHRSLLESVGGFRQGLVCSQERDLHLRLACAGYHFIHLPHILYTVRRQPGSISSDPIRLLKQRAAVFQHAFNLLLQARVLNDERRRAIAGLLAGDARELLRFGCPDLALAQFSMARTIHAAGGLDHAYRLPARLLYRCFGPRATETLVCWKRGLPRARATSHAVT